MAASSSSSEESSSERELSSVLKADEKLLRSKDHSIAAALKDNFPMINGYLFPSRTSSYGTDTFKHIFEWVQDSSGDAYPMAVVTHRTAPRVVVYFHGNAEDVGDCVQRLHLYSEWLNSHVVAVEYPGYGITKGRCTENIVVERALHAMRYVVRVFRVPLSKIIVFGRSIGTGVAAQISKQCGDRLAGLILQSPFESVKRLAAEHTWQSMFIPDKFDNVEAMSALKTLPVLIYHCANDRVIPFSHGQRVYDSCPCDKSTKLIVEDKWGDHMRFTKDHLKMFLETFVWDMNKRIERNGLPKLPPLALEVKGFQRLPPDAVSQIMTLSKNALRPADDDSWVLKHDRHLMTAEELEMESRTGDEQIAMIFMNIKKREQT
jgi:pimeloyl-ACP methyl ester carboxylesterase